MNRFGGVSTTAAYMSAVFRWHHEPRPATDNAIGTLLKPGHFAIIELGRGERRMFFQLSGALPGRLSRSLPMHRLKIPAGLTWRAFRALQDAPTASLQPRTTPRGRSLLASEFTRSQSESARYFFSGSQRKQLVVCCLQASCLPLAQAAIGSSMQPGAPPTIGKTCPQPGVPAELPVPAI